MKFRTFPQFVALASALLIVSAAAPSPGQIPDIGGAVRDTVQGAQRATEGAQRATEGAQRTVDEAAEAPARQLQGRAGVRGDATAEALDQAAGVETRAGSGFGFDFRTGDDGLSISDVTRNSAAARAGIRANDRIISVDGRQFQSRAQLDAYLRSRGDRELPWVIRRDGRNRTLNLNLGSRLQARSNIGLRFSNRGELLLDDVVQGSLAARAGLRAGDRIVTVDGRRFDTQAALNAYLRQRAGTRAAFVVHRNGRRNTINVMLHGQTGNRNQAGLGVTLRSGSAGVWVTSVYENSPAHRAGLRSGDLIVRLNGADYIDQRNAVRAISSMSSGETLSIGFVRAGRYQDMDVVLGTRGEALATGSAQFDEGRAEFDGELPPFSEESGRRTVARPDIESQSRLEALERQINLLQQQLEGMRTDLQDSGTLKRNDTDLRTKGEIDAEAGAEASEEADARPELESGVEAKAQGAATTEKNAPEIPALPKP